MARSFPEFPPLDLVNITPETLLNVYKGANYKLEIGILLEYFFQQGSLSGVRYRGLWSSQQSYSVGDLVATNYGLGMFRCIQEIEYLGAGYESDPPDVNPDFWADAERSVQPEVKEITGVGGVVVIDRNWVGYPRVINRVDLSGGNRVLEVGDLNEDPGYESFAFKPGDTICIINDNADKEDFGITKDDATIRFPLGGPSESIPFGSQVILTYKGNDTNPDGEWIAITGSLRKSYSKFVCKLTTPFSSLPASPVLGMTALLSDCTLAYTGANIGAAAAGGGSNMVPVYYNGSSWRVGAL